MDNFVWAFAGVYGPNIGVRRYIRDELVGLMSCWELLWCIMGDFNVFPSERSGDSRHSPAIADFSDFIFDKGLLDTQLVSGKFTWSNNRG